MSEILARFIRFAGVGGVATALQYLLLIALVEIVRVAPLYASISSYLASAALNYWANYHFTFSATVPHRQAMPRFVLVSGAGLVINALVFHVVHTGFGLMYLIAQILASGFVLLWNFLANHFWSFSAGNRSGRVAE